MLSTLSLLAIATLANARGYFEDPPARQPGAAYKAACGEQAYNMMSSDINGNIQGLEQLTSNQADFDAEACGLWLCKGMKFDDNTARVQTYSVGQEVDMFFDIKAPHDGYANVSVIDTASKSIIASDLIKWDEYALTSVPMKKVWTNFMVIIPETLEGKCGTAGECVLQMHWAAETVDQTYQSCVDFTVGGGGGNATQKLKLKRHARSWA